MDRAVIPIDAEFVFAAIFSNVDSKGVVKRRVVDVTQCLVVERQRANSDISSVYIASITPLPSYRKSDDRINFEFLCSGDVFDFTGSVLYRSLEGVYVAVESYRNGVVTSRHDFETITEDNVAETFRILKAVIGTSDFVSGTAMAFTKGGEMEPGIPIKTIYANAVTVVAKDGSNNWPIVINVRFDGKPGEKAEEEEMYESPTGGSSGGIFNQSGMPTVIKLDCSSSNETNAKNATADLYKILTEHRKETYLKNAINFSDFMSKVRANPNREHGTVLDYGNGFIALRNVHDAPSDNGFVSVEMSPNTIAVLHSHPSGHATPPSALDAWALAEDASGFCPQLQASYVVVGSDTYSLQIVDAAAAGAFARMNGITNGTSDFAPDTPAGMAWKDATSRMQNISNDNDRYCAVMAYVLDRCNSGIVLSKMSSGGAFAPYGVRTNSNGKAYPTQCK